MKFKNYINDVIGFLGINAMLALIVLGIMLYIEIGLLVILFILILWFLPLLSYMILDYLKYVKYFKEIEVLLDSLDKIYLLPEVVEEQYFFVGQKLNEILKITSRDMHENINQYKNIEKEYREYINIWVHEIKTPIASSKLIIENNWNETTKKIDIEMDKIDSYVEQVLYYAKSENVNKDYIIKKTNLREIIINVIQRNSRDFINKNIKVNLGSIDNVVYTDSKWIEFIINQLISNSIKYVEKNDGEIKIATQRINNSVSLTIIDNGIGIIDKDIHRVFENGFTGENGRLYAKSTGIGLYLSRNLANKLGIKLLLSSTQGLGTKVTIVFPLDDKEYNYY
ncbi:MAG: sensor histidine kinase [Tetragenococcus koreensis]|nr:sensor histidine kinase [Tetragenococcus koreensis]